MRRLASCLLLYACVCAPAAAEPASERTEWELDENPSGPGDVTSPSSPEQARFWDRLQQQAFDDICRSIKLDVEQDLALADYAGVQIKGRRALKRYPDKKLALVDSAELDVSLGVTHKLIDVVDEIPLSLNFEGRIKGTAHVVRPLGTEKSCGELDRLVNLLDFKTVVPASPERLSQMAVGEIWKLPLVLSAGGGFSAGAPVGPVTVAISFSYGQGESASVSVLRLSEDAIRLRLRIDKANIFDGGGNVRLSLPIQEYLALDGTGGFLDDQADRLVWQQIHRQLEGALGLSQWRRDGRKVLLEFVVDARDAGQLEALSQFLKGDLDVLFLLRKITQAASEPFVREGTKTEYIQKLERRYAGKLGAPPSYTGADDYVHSGRRLFLKLPILMGLEGSSSKEFDRIIAGDKDAEVHVDQASTRRSGTFLNVPFLGQIVKGDTQKTVQAFTRVDDKGFADSPLLVYIQQTGFVRHRREDAREMVDDANAVLKLAGARGEGDDPRWTLPADALFPKPPQPPTPPREATDAGDPVRPQGPIYRSAVSAFTLVFDQKALEEILWTPAEVVVRAFTNALEGGERDVMGRLLAHATIETDGTIRYDRRGLRDALGDDPQPSDEHGWSTLDTAERLARSATGLVADLAEARAGAWEERSQALVRLISGSGRSDLSYEDALRVLVQLVDPAGIFGEFSLYTNKKVSGESDVSARYRLHPGNAGAQLKDAVRLKERFAEPSILSD